MGQEGGDKAQVIIELREMVDSREEVGENHDAKADLFQHIFILTLPGPPIK
jgi:hypothetical protein